MRNIATGFPVANKYFAIHLEWKGKFIHLFQGETCLSEGCSVPGRCKARHLFKGSGIMVARAKRLFGGPEWPWPAPGPLSFRFPYSQVREHGKTPYSHHRACN